MSSRKSDGDPVRHGIIGCGRVASNHLRAVQEAGGKVTWCCDLKLDRAGEFARAAGGAHVTSRAEEVFADPALESVSICTDHGTHAPLTMAALRHNKHVLVEKPMAIRLEAAQRMLEEADRSRRLLGVCFQHRFDPLWIAARDVIRKGVLGRITSVTLMVQCAKDVDYYRGWRGTRRQEGGSALINQGIHSLDLAIWTLGEPEVLSAASATLKFETLIETEDTFSGSLRFPGGALGVLLCTNTSAVEWDSRVEFIGMEGRLALGAHFPDLLLACDLPESAQEDSRRLWAISEAPTPLPSGISYYGISHDALLGNFLHAVRGKEPLFIDAAEGIRTQRVVETLYRTAKESRDRPNSRMSR